MTKLFSFALVLVMTLTMFVACGGTGETAEPIDSPIVGKWGDGDFVVEFTADGVCYHNGEYWADYTVDGNTLTMTSDDHSTIEATLEFDGDTLTMRRSNGNVLEMQRVMG